MVDCCVSLHYIHYQNCFCYFNVVLTIAISVILLLFILNKYMKGNDHAITHDFSLKFQFFN